MLKVPNLGEWRIEQGYMEIDNFVIAPIDKLEGIFYNKTITKPRTNRWGLDHKKSQELESDIFDMMDHYYYSVDYVSLGRSSAVTEEQSPWRT